MRPPGAPTQCALHTAINQNMLVFCIKPFNGLIKSLHPQTVSHALPISPLHPDPPSQACSTSCTVFWQLLLTPEGYLLQGLSTYCSQPGRCLPGFPPGCLPPHPFDFSVSFSKTLSGPAPWKVAPILYPSPLLLFQHLSQLVIVFPTKSKLYGTRGFSSLVYCCILSII